MGLPTPEMRVKIPGRVRFDGQECPSYTEIDAVPVSPKTSDLWSARTCHRLLFHPFAIVFPCSVVLRDFTRKRSTILQFIPA